MEWYCSTGITSISLKTILRGICKGISERNVQIRVYCKNVGRPKKSTAFLALCLHTLTALCTCASCPVSSVSLFIDHSTLAGWCGHYHTGHVHFPRTFFLISILGWVDLKAQVNFILFFNCNPRRTRNHDRIMAFQKQSSVLATLLPQLPSYPMSRGNFLFKSGTFRFMYPLSRNTALHHSNRGAGEVELHSRQGRTRGRVSVEFIEQIPEADKDWQSLRNDRWRHAGPGGHLPTIRTWPVSAYLLVPIYSLVII